MLVSIVTPSFNQARYLEATIQSVLEQENAQIEYIIMDGGSTDGSVEIIQKYTHRLAWWVSEPDRGQSDALNKGFTHAHGEVMAWINSDDTYQAGAVAEAVAFLQEHPDVDFVYGDANYIDRQGRVIGRFPAAQTDYRRMLQGYVHIPQQATFWRSSLWQKVGQLDSTFFFAFDYEFWVRAAKMTRLAYHPRLWANFRLHDDAKTNYADDRCWPEMLKVHQRQGGGSISIMRAKYFLRRLAAPYLRWKRRKMYRSAASGL